MLYVCVCVCVWSKAWPEDLIMPKNRARKRIRVRFDGQTKPRFFSHAALLYAVPYCCQLRLLGVITSFLWCTFSPSVVPELCCYWECFPVSGQRLFRKNVLNNRLCTMCFCRLIYGKITRCFFEVEIFLLALLKEESRWCRQLLMLGTLLFFTSVSLAIDRTVNWIF